MFIKHYAISELGVAYDAVDGVLGSENFLGGFSRFAPGYRSRSAQGGEFVYAKFASAVTDGQIVIVDSDGVATPITTTNAATELGTEVGVVVVAVAAAANEFGFVQVMGVQGVRTVVSAAAHLPLATTATAGVLTAAGAVGARLIPGIVLQAAAAGTGSPITAATIVNPTIGIAIP